MESAGEPAVDTSAKVTARSTEHVHDGFYLRLGAGPGYGRIRVQTDRLSQPDVSVRGVTASFEIWAGGTLAPGIAVGGFLSGTGLRTSEAQIGDDAKAEATGNSTLLGVFLDAFPKPAEGYHFGGLLGLAAAEVESDAEEGVAATEFSGNGLGLGVFAGVDTWIAKQWSFGVALRLFGSVTVEETSPSGVELTKQGTSYAATALASVLYH